MTAYTRVMRIGRRTHQRIIMAAGAGCSSYRDTGMAGITCVQGFPGTRMTGRTVAAGSKGLAGSRAYQAAVGIMAARATIMCIRRAAYQRIIMAADTGCGSDRYQ